MPYAEGRIIHDADSHIMEPADWLFPYADAKIRDRMERLYQATLAPGEHEQMADHLALQADPAFRADDADEIMQRKNWLATGATIKEDRPQALDLLGFQTQLVFNTFANQSLQKAEHGDDVDFAYGMAEAHNRAILDFCSPDPARLLNTCYLPLMDMNRSRAFAEAAIKAGAKSLLIACACPKHHSPSHIGLDPVWAVLQEAGVPVLFHVGSGGDFFDYTYFDNGLPLEKDFHGGAENFRSVDYMAIPGPVQMTLATMILDGVLERFPRLMFGVIELGASWVPSWMKYMDSAIEAFGRHEARLQNLSLKPGEYVQRQVRVTPYPTEDAGWIMREAGEAVALFSSDYPHVEGGRNPLGRFEASLTEVGAEGQDRFYRRNFEELMGPMLQ